MNHYVYWLHDETCSDPQLHGYVGVTSRPRKRLKEHRNHRRVPDHSQMSILFEGNRGLCHAIEHVYRPGNDIGWNRAPGGAATRRGGARQEHHCVGCHERVCHTLLEKYHKKCWEYFCS